MQTPEWMKEKFKPNYPSWVNSKETEYGTLINGVHMPNLKTRSISVQTAKAYGFTFEEPFGWAIFTINDSSGEFSIQSDWGNWSHRWNVNHLGVDKNIKNPLTHFIADRGDAGYLAKKLYNGREMKRFSPENTEHEWRKMVLQSRREGYLKKEAAREIWDDIGQLDFSDAHSLNNSIYHLDGKELNRFFDPFWDYLFDENVPEATILTYHLLPFFINYLRKEVLNLD